jgi:hypothetical protein
MTSEDDINLPFWDDTISTLCTTDKRTLGSHH